MEGRADILVADHLKPLQAPSNSVSYRFIDESIKRGELASLDEHRIGRPAARPAGSTRMPGKATRTPFTSEDDKILREWVIQRARIGEKVSGNNIYQKLAQQVVAPWTLRSR